MVRLLEPSKYMEAKDHLSLTLVQGYFQQFELEKPAPTNAVFDQNSDKRTIELLEMSHTTSPCSVMPLYIVILNYKGTTCIGTSSQYRTPL